MSEWQVKHSQGLPAQGRPSSGWQYSSTSQGVWAAVGGLAGNRATASTTTPARDANGVDHGTCLLA